MSAEESGSQPAQSEGLFNSIRTMVGTLLAIVQTRAELLSTELEEERIRLTSMLAWSFVMLFCAGLGVIFVTLLFVVVLWDDHRLLAVGIPAAAFLLAAFVAARVVAAKAQAKPKLFSASLAELSKDRERLTPRS
jgi:uncharacterized membrane protein YqjE